MLLAKASSGVARFYKEMGLEPALSDSPEFSEPVSVAKAIFTKAAKGLTILAGINLIFGCNGPERADEIEKYLGKKGDVTPKKLKNE